MTRRPILTLSHLQFFHLWPLQSKHKHKLHIDKSILSLSTLSFFLLGIIAWLVLQKNVELTLDVSTALQKLGLECQGCVP